MNWFLHHRITVHNYCLYLWPGWFVCADGVYEVLSAFRILVNRPLVHYDFVFKGWCSEKYCPWLLLGAFSTWLLSLCWIGVRWIGVHIVSVLFDIFLGKNWHSFTTMFSSLKSGSSIWLRRDVVVYQLGNHYIFWNSHWAV